LAVSASDTTAGTKIFMVRGLLSGIAPPSRDVQLPVGPQSVAGQCQPASPNLWSGQLACWLIGWCEAFPETIGKERGRAGPRTGRNTSSASQLRWRIPWKEVSEEAVNVGAYATRYHSEWIWQGLAKLRGRADEPGEPPRRPPARTQEVCRRPLPKATR